MVVTGQGIVSVQNEELLPPSSLAVSVHARAFTREGGPGAKEGRALAPFLVMQMGEFLNSCSSVPKPPANLCWLKFPLLHICLKAAKQAQVPQSPLFCT